MSLSAGICRWQIQGLNPKTDTDIIFTMRNGAVKAYGFERSINKLAGQTADR
jgi:hypothetical protein